MLHPPQCPGSRGDEELPTPLEDLKAGVRFLIKDRPNVFRLLLFAAALNFVLIGYSGVGFPYTIRTVLGFGCSGMLDGVARPAWPACPRVAGAFIAGLFAAKLDDALAAGADGDAYAGHGPTGYCVPAAGRRMDQTRGADRIRLRHDGRQLLHESHRRARHPAQYARGQWPAK